MVFVLICFIWQHCKLCAVPIMIQTIVFTFCPWALKLIEPLNQRTYTCASDLFRSAIHPRDANAKAGRHVVQPLPEGGLQTTW